MQVSDPLLSGQPVSVEDLRSRLHRQLVELEPELGSGDLALMLAIVLDRERTAESIRDALSTRLMEAFRRSTGRGSFGLLYELNGQHLLVQVAGRLRRYASQADPRDVLQEVFFNIYRYPHRFNSEREDAFRVWSAMIVRNTVLKHLRALGRGGRAEVPFEDLSEQPEVQDQGPLTGAIERESTTECQRVYLTYLHLYLRFYGMLSERERNALHMVEVEERSYRDAAQELGIKLENLKMVIFRARRKIHRSMRRVFDGMSPDCRPARTPRASGADEDREEFEERSDAEEARGSTGSSHSSDKERHSR
jgi:RNA polymerase sigma factor (sigma-70 family)